MKAGRVGVSTALLAFVLSGCAVTRENQNACRVGWMVMGAAAGGGGAGVGVGEGVSNPSDGEVAGAAAAGTIAGGLLGLLASHYICQVEEKPVPPPPPPAPSPAPRKIETLTGPSFEFNKDHLTAEGRAHVDHAVQVIQQNPGMQVVVEGNTDSVGSDDYNMKLSRRRAETVRDYMVQKGISASRIDTVAYGETRPVASNKTAEGRAQNRRVDIVAR
jgi:OOP family OmpA-OmpF porin